MIETYLKKLVPASLRPAARALYYLPGHLAGRASDLVERVKSRHSLTPPKSMVFVGDGDFEGVGKEFKRYFLDFAGLQPNERVLDVGCGIGRMAVPLTDYLSSEGEYYGFDIVKYGIDWSRRHISSRFPNFHFRHVAIYSKRYNSRGRLRASELVFPYEDDFFDFAFLTSVFTHMLPPDVDHYLSEISRVLKPGGRCLITFFLLNKGARELLSAGRGTLDFKYEMDGYLTIAADNPEAAVAYDEEYVRGLFSQRRLEIVEPIHYGQWCGRERFVSYQDMVVARTGAAK